MAETLRQQSTEPYKMNTGSQTIKQRAVQALGIFSGVQVCTMAFSAIKAKCIAYLLGADGLGLIALYSDALETINSISQMNLRASAVKHMSGVVPNRLLAIKKSILQLGALLAATGGIATLALSPLLSRFTFGNDGHTWQFALLSVTVFLNAIIQPHQAMLQAGAQFKRLAWATLFGASTGTAIAITLYYIWGIDGIVPSLVAISISTALSYYIFTPRLPSAKLTAKETCKESKPILKLGFFLTVATFTTTLSSYIFISWLYRQAGESEVGLYKAGYTIINQYVGVIFTAMAVEYFPRISGVSTSSWRTGIYIRQEIKMLTSILAPCIILFIPMVPWIVNILYSSEFLPAVPYIIIAATGTLLKASSYVMAYVIPARGDGGIYMLLETSSSILFIVLSMAGYLMAGLSGVAVGYAVWYGAYLIAVCLVNKLRYNITGLGKHIIATVAVTVMIIVQCLLMLSDLKIAAWTMSAVSTTVAAAVWWRKKGG